MNTATTNIRQPRPPSGETAEVSRLRAENKRFRQENEQLRRVFDIATDQFNELGRQVERLERELAAERSCRDELERGNRRLEKELSSERAKANKFADMLFGLKSEKLKLSDIKVVNKDTLVVNETGRAGTRNDGVGNSNDEKKKNTDKKDRGKRGKGAQDGHKGNGRKIPEGLPVVDKVINLPEGEIIHGIPAEDWVKQEGMEEISYQIRKEVNWYVERIIRRKYTPPPGCGSDVPKIIAAPMPGKLIPQGKYALEVWLDILIDKFQQHIPVQRQIFAARQAGVDMIAGTVFGGLKTIYETYLNPLYEQLIVELQDARHWHGDETKWYMLCDTMKKHWYMWGFKSGKVTAFVLDSTRSSVVPAATLLGIDDLKQIKEPVEIPEEKMRILSVDRYSAYKALANLGLLILAFCWAHVRRDFTDIIKKYPAETGLIKWAEKWLLKISEVYRINNLRIKHPPDSEVFLEYDTKLRKTLNKMGKEIDAELEMDQEQVHEARAKAMESMKKHWEGLAVFVEHPEIPMDNNRMENSIRPCALGRHNYIGNHSEWGGGLSACMYSIIQTCIQNDINPRAYLKFYFEKSISGKGRMSSETIKAMLPGNLNKSIVEKFDLSLK